MIFNTNNVGSVFSKKAVLWDNKSTFISAKTGETARLQKLATELIQPGMRVLDAGSGSGKITKRLHDLIPDVDFIGVDVSLNMACKFRKKFDNNKRLHVMVSDIQNFCYKSNIFDCIIMQQVMHHLPDPFLAIQEAYRILKKGGLLFLLTVGDQYQKEFFLYDKEQTIVNDPLGRITYKKLLDTLCKIGFSVCTSVEDFFQLSFAKPDSYYDFMHSIGSVDKVFHYNYSGDEFNKRAHFFNCVPGNSNIENDSINLTGHYITAVVKKQ